MRHTRQNIIAIVFDFDDTLAPDSTTAFLTHQGVDVPRFWRRQVDPLLADEWDPIPAYLFAMLEVSGARPDAPITRDSLTRWGRRQRFYPGVPQVFNRIRKHVAAVNPDAEVEFYIISSGIGDLIRSTRIAPQFSEIWACDFSYDPAGRIQFPKKVVSFTDKTRHLFQIAKGLVGPDFRSKPFEVNKKVSGEDIRIPFNQTVVVGDGYTDVPCFSMIRKNGGIAIGVFDRGNREKWGRAWGFIEDGRVSNLVPADYRKNSALDISLCMAAENIARKIALRDQTYQG